MEMIVEDLINGYITVAENVRSSGQTTYPRGQETREIIGSAIHVINPLYCMPIGIGRQLNTGIGVAEALQLIAGESHPDLMVEKFPNFRSFTDGGTWFHGAYGPRVRRQVPKVIETLRADPDTRQALVVLWDPQHDGYNDVRDTPCTTSLQFLIRDNKLCLVTYMRSNDVWWGLAYDAYQFVMLQYQIACQLGIGLGTYTHMVGSLHMYERDYEKVDRLEETSQRTSLVSALPGYTWDDRRDWASRILRDDIQGGMKYNDLRVALHGAP